MAQHEAQGSAISHPIASGVGWRVSDVRCNAGPGDTPFEEAHEWVSVAVVLSGSFVYRSTHGREVMTVGAMLLGNQGACFCCSHEHDTGDRCLAFHYDPALIEEVASGLAGIGRTTFHRHRIPLLETTLPIHAEARNLLRGSDPFHAEEVAIRIAGAAMGIANEADMSRATPNEERRALAATALIDRHYDQAISLRDLAAAAGLSRFHFVRVFGRVIGVTPYRYLLRRRLLAAAVHLQGREYSVTDAALASGFADLSDFTRRFRANFGSTPARYRERAK